VVSKYSLQVKPDETFMKKCLEKAMDCIHSGNKSNAERAIYLVTQG